MSADAATQRLIDRIKEIADEAGIPDELYNAADQMAVIRDDLDLSGLNVEVIRNWVQLCKILGLPLDNKTRAMVMLLGAYDNAKSEATLWEGHARRLGYGL